jgi:hypothetical protein
MEINNRSDCQKYLAFQEEELNAITMVTLPHTLYQTNISCSFALLHDTTM